MNQEHSLSKNRRRPLRSAQPKTWFVKRTKQPNFVLSVIMTTVKMLFVVVLILGIAGGGLLMGVAKAWIETAPPLDLTAFDETQQTSFVYDKYGNLITELKGHENRVKVSLSEVPQTLQNAFIAIEDMRFHTHNGVDIKRIIGAFVSNMGGGGTLQGGSTITQQLVKQTMLSTEQTYKRKLQEAYLALQLETQVSKDKILEEYLNVIFLGGSNYGVKVAAVDYFNKDLKDLTLRECAMLAGLNRNPSRYNPRTTMYRTKTFEVTNGRTDEVLKRMFDQGLITQDEYNRALNETVHIVEESVNQNQPLYDHPYYVEYAIYDVVTHMLRMSQLDDNKTNRAMKENELRTGGYHIYTSLDPHVQETAEKVIHNWKNYPSMRRAAHKVYKASLGNGQYLEVQQPQAAAAVLDHRTGELVAIVGGRNNPTMRKQLNRAYQMDMPVGSSIKPIAVYGPAFDLGNSPGSPVLNLPLRIKGWDSKNGYPQNYGNGKHTGPESMRLAMTKSHNTAAAQALFAYVGIENSVNYLMKLGVSRSHIKETGAGLALGSSGISVIEMAGAFGAIANKGQYLEPMAFVKVLDSYGNMVIDGTNSQIKRQAFKPSTAWMLTDVLEACVSSGGTGARARFSGMTVAGKTGTNSNAVGVFFAGMTPYLSGAVWIGHEDYKPLVSNATGGTYAAPLWSELMKQLHKELGYTKNKPIIADSPESLGLVKASVCSVSGMKPTAACKADANGHKVIKDYFLKGTEPTKNCNMHRSVRLCSSSKQLPTQYCPSVRSYGSVYIPDGHPLSNDKISVVRKYFKGATRDKSKTSIGYCTQHTKNSKKDKDEDNEESIEKSAKSAISAAKKLADNKKVSKSDRKKLNSAISSLQKALKDENKSRIKKLTSQLKSLNKKVKGKL